jgi:enamine deaminase RidA (YjgF/YER057c/UK114 family)
VTWQGSPLARPGARVAVEAIAVSAQRPDLTTLTADGGALLPAGSRIFLSGQAERGSDVASSVALTMASLLRSAAELGAAPAGVAQIRVFLQPFSGRDDALAQIAPLFPAGKCPPVIVTEWTLPLPVEIEMILARDRGAAKLEAPLTFPVLAGKPRSPRFSHAAIVATGVPLLFLSDIDAGPNVSPTEEWPTIFARLGPALGRAGSSFRLLVKATYLLEDGSPRNSLNDTRAVYYDPLRPPAASAVGVRSVGIPGRAASLDMIAVPRDAAPLTP